MESLINLSTCSITLEEGYNSLQQQGNLVYEYNPLQVFRLNHDLEITKVSYSTGERREIKEKCLKNSLVGLTTDKLKFDLNHPVKMIAQLSYDGSVNLILNDGTNAPRLINTRFTTTGMDTYKIIDRDGDNDTNIYDEDSFESDISLYKKTNTIVKVSLQTVTSGGNLKVGNYVFYFKLTDADGNETDIVAESGIVSCYIGGINQPSSIQGGILDENSYKMVTFNVSNIDSAYNYLNVYYTRSTSDIDLVANILAYKINHLYTIVNGKAEVSVTGFERTTLVDLVDINAQYATADAVTALTANANMLFLGNIKRPEINYKELTDLSLRWLPKVGLGESVGFVNEEYVDSTNLYEYYNPHNIYNNLGYWDDEIYRFGVVYILKDYTLSPVFNVRGAWRVNKDTLYINYDVFGSDGERKYIEIDKSTYLLKNNENAKGVIWIQNNEQQITNSAVKPLKLNMTITTDAYEELKKYVNGYFFVRQKRIPTTLCLAVIIGQEDLSGLPMLPIGKYSYNPADETGSSGSTVLDTLYGIESFLGNDLILNHNFESRWRKVEGRNANKGCAAIAPEFELRQSYLNHLFTGAEFLLKSPNSSINGDYFLQKGRHFYNMNYTSGNEREELCLIMAIGDGLPAARIKSQLYSAMAGDPTNAVKFSYINRKRKSEDNTEIVRGIWGPYLGIYDNHFTELDIVNVKIPNYNEGQMTEYFRIRMEDASPFYAISDRYDINNSKLYSNIKNGSILIGEGLSAKTYNTVIIDDIYRGDCYICNFTHRMCRNFLDPSAPVNNEIVSEESWKKYFVADETTAEESNDYDSRSNKKINLGDVNAINIGHWVTVKVMSNYNLSLRSADISHPLETGLSGHPRGFYPLYYMSSSGESKFPESEVFNLGYARSVSDRINYEQPNVPAIKNIFHTRIMYSDKSVNDSFKNGYRVFKSTHFRDFPIIYGSIIHLESWFGNLIIIFEHGVGVVPINERALLAESQGGSVFINNSNVLPETPKMLSDMFGSQWSDSIVKTTHYVYGVDTVGKKIWRTNGSTFEIISDFKVQKFLNDHISLKEHENTPILGLRNVKSHYNAFKKDIMFTFYDDINTLEENVWNLCYNEVMGKFSTFYSWVPSYSCNIDNIFFSFDRNTSKYISKNVSDILKIKELLYSVVILTDRFYTSLMIYKYGNIITKKSVETRVALIPGGPSHKEEYINIIKTNSLKETCMAYNEEFIKFIDINDSTLNGWYFGGEIVLNFESENKFNLSIADDCVKNRYRIINNDDKYYLFFNENITDPTINVPLRIELYKTDYSQEELSSSVESTLFTTLLITTNSEYIDHSTAFWKHGQAGLMSTKGDIKPTHWYGKQHPFELEFVVAADPTLHKIFDNLLIISNKALPESFHYEVVGEVYNFANDKKNAYWRQEATKHLYLYNGADVSYNSNYLKILPELRDILYGLSGKKDASIMFPINYGRVDTLNEIYDSYLNKQEANKFYESKSGTEIVWDKQMNEFKLATHSKCCPFGKYYWQEIGADKWNSLLYKGYPKSMFKTQVIDEVTHYYILLQYGRLLGNALYQEDKWLIQIPSIKYWIKNEDEWKAKVEIDGQEPQSYPPINLANNPIPESMKLLNITSNNDIPYELQDRQFSITKGIEVTPWTLLKETRIRDKYLKIRVRYSGKDLVVITALLTMYTMSFA